jgi:hypothetical protein
MRQDDKEEKEEEEERGEKESPESNRKAVLESWKTIFGRGRVRGCVGARVRVWNISLARLHGLGFESRSLLSD